MINLSVYTKLIEWEMFEWLFQKKREKICFQNKSSDVDRPFWNKAYYNEKNCEIL